MSQIPALIFPSLGVFHGSENTINNRRGSTGDQPHEMSLPVNYGRKDISDEEVEAINVSNNNNNNHNNNNVII